jgi:hypothetical protein
MNTNTNNSFSQSTKLNFGPPIAEMWRDGSGNLNFWNPIGGGWKDGNGNLQFGTPGEGNNYM